jgi:hypothetical protein
MHAEESEQPLVSSALISDQARLIAEIYGADTLTRAVAALPPALRDEMAAMTSSGWSSLDLPRELKNNVAAIIGVDPMALQREIVRKGVERTLTTVWRFFLRQLGDEGLSKRIPILYSRSFNRGTLKLASWRNGGAELELHGWPRMPEYDLMGLMVGGQKLFELAGRVDVKANATRKWPLILIHVTWQSR